MKGLGKVKRQKIRYTTAVEVEWKDGEWYAFGMGAVYSYTYYTAYSTTVGIPSPYTAVYSSLNIRAATPDTAVCIPAPT